MKKQTYTDTQGTSWTRVTKAQAKKYYEDSGYERELPITLPVYLDEYGLETYIEPYPKATPEYKEVIPCIIKVGLMITSHNNHPDCIDLNPAKHGSWEEMLMMWENELDSSSDYLAYWIATEYMRS